MSSNRDAGIVEHRIEIVRRLGAGKNSSRRARACSRSSEQIDRTFRP